MEQKSLTQVFLAVFTPTAFFLFDWLFRRPWRCCKSAVIDGERGPKDIAKAAFSAAWFMYLIWSTVFQI